MAYKIMTLIKYKGFKVLFQSVILNILEIVFERFFHNTYRWNSQTVNQILTNRMFKSYEEEI